MNRIAEGIRRVNEALEITSLESIEKVTKTADDVSIIELCRYQDVRALAQAEGRLTLEESMQMHLILGGGLPSECQWKSRTLAEKLIAMQVIASLASIGIGS